MSGGVLLLFLFLFRMPDSTLIFFWSLPKFHENDNKDKTKIHKFIGRKSRGGSMTTFWSLKNKSVSSECQQNEESLIQS